MKKILSLILAVISLFACFACTPQQQTKSEPTNKIVINTFEKDRDFNLMKVRGTLGKVSFNKEKDFVRTGEGSAKVTVVHNPYKPGAPTLYQSFINELENTDYSDFDFISFITVWVYNAQTTTRRIGINPVYEFVNSAHTQSSGNTTWFELAPLAWTQVNYSVEREYVPINGENHHGVEGVNFRFDRPKDTDDLFYLDDINLFKTTIPVQEVNKVLRQDEICSFDYKWQIELFQKMDWLPETLAPEVSLDSTVTADGTGSSLKIKAPAGTEGGGYYPGLIFTPEQIGMANWDLYEADDKFVMDVFVPETNGILQIHLLMFAETLQQGYCNKLIYLKSNQWNRVEFKVSELEHMNITNDVNFNKTQWMEITFREDGMDREIWIDNIRMETK